MKSSSPSDESSVPTPVFEPSARRHSLLSRLKRPQATVDQVILVASMFWALAANHAFVMSALGGRNMSDSAVWGFALALMAIVVAGHALIVSLVAHRHTIKPVVALLTLAAAAGSYFIGAFGVVLDPTMLRNVLRTDVGEARELLSPAFLLHMAIFGLLPLALLWRVRIVRRPWKRAVTVRLSTIFMSASVLVIAVWSVFQPLSSLMRNHKEARYLITPANILWSVSSVVAADAKGAAQPRQAIGLDAAPGPSWTARKRPMVVLLVVGETARAANWGLSGYARQTTPELASLGVVNFSRVDSCGSNTETSLPCMFAPIGRRDYDESRIRGQESLMHVLARAGVGVHWRDNQSGCKGVCDGLPGDTVASLAPPGACEGERCLDAGLVSDLDARLRSARGTQVWVLHMLGNHGPSYFRRYPPEFARFQPACRDDDLRRCTPQEVVNAYDNAILYTDHVLATAIRTLQARSAEVDSALLYVSDHGESLGEKGLFLHGLPYAIAPREQTQVPMVWWASDGFEQAAGLRRGCLDSTLRRRATEPAAHDHLFHTVLGMVDVRTSVYERPWDLAADCRVTAP